ncbi:MAG: hypothetical protein P8N76_14860 [Pirellulaceae bacterium]|nr:hypothetical protein [Pirellulaceae bacterium]
MRLPIGWTMCRLCFEWFALLALIGCGQDATISRYQVPHEPRKPAADLPQQTATARATAPQRTLAAIVPYDGKAWFFKSLGPPGQIAKIANDFESVLKSVTFVDGKPQWQLPAGWTQSAGNQFRFATLKAGSIEVAVSSLPMPPEGDFQQYLLANVNRWRGQVSLPDVTAAGLSKVTREIALAKGVATLFDSNMGAPSTGEKISVDDGSESNPQGPRAISANGMNYDVPVGWKSGPQRPMRLATFLVNNGGGKVEITLSRLGVNPGSMLANVNRWRAQVGLNEIDQAKLDQETQTLQVDGASCSYFELNSDSGQAVDVVVVKRPDSTLFIKMMGDRDLASKERTKFKQFAESFRFTPK